MLRAGTVDGSGFIILWLVGVAQSGNKTMPLAPFVRLKYHKVFFIPENSQRPSQNFGGIPKNPGQHCAKVESAGFLALVHSWRKQRKREVTGF